MRLRPFSREHYRQLEDRNALLFNSPTEMSTAMLQCLERENSWTLEQDGTVIGCGGTLLRWPGRSEAWLLLCRDSGPHMLAVVRAIHKILDGTVSTRIECTVRQDFTPGHKLMRLLGFVVETPQLRKFGPLGEDHIGYVLIRE